MIIEPESPSQFQQFPALLVTTVPKNPDGEESGDDIEIREKWAENDFQDNP
jgi:hypothetical protein